MNFDKVLIVDDEVSIHRILAKHLCKMRFSVTSVASLSEAREELLQEQYDLALVDIKLPDGCGQHLIEPLLSRRNGRQPIVVMMSGHADSSTARACIGQGAFDVMHKPFSLEEVDFLLHRARAFAPLLRRHEPSNGSAAVLDARGKLPPALMGHSPEVAHLRALLKKVAPMETTILLIGESGVGKGQVGEAIHDLSPRAGQRFCRVNCSAGTEEQIEREIFGYYDGRDGGRMEAGRLEQANGGTLLLEEINELTPRLQLRLLRAMRERGFDRNGAAREFVPLDVRYVVTACRDLKAVVEEGGVRDDFYRQINVLPITVAPLRERKADLSLLAGEWLANFGKRLGISPKGITPEALEVLIGYPWPGNMQEMESALERALVLGGVEAVIDTPAFDFLQMPPGPPLSTDPMSGLPGGEGFFLEPLLSLEEMEKKHVLRALEYTNQNRTRAASLLKISVRTLRNKLHLYRLQMGEAVGARGEPALFARSGRLR